MLKHQSILRRRFVKSTVLLDLAEAAFWALQPQQLVQQAVSLNGDSLTIQGKQFSLKRYQRIFVVGGGKATYGMAEALVGLLGNRVTAGVINVPHPAKRRLGSIIVRAASHPYPDLPTVAGAKAIYKLVEQATAKDLVICLISGGGSSMLAMPLPGVRLKDKIKLTKQLMHLSADIVQLNTIRKHLSALKGGRLAALAAPATVISFIISDVFGDRLDMIASGPTVADTTTAADALAILDRYKLGTKALRQALLRSDTPKRLPKNVYNFLIGNNQLALDLIANQAKEHGLHPVVLTSCLRGEAKEVAQVLTAIAKEVQQYNRPARMPALLIAGGETTVTVLGKGHGGRNQELVLAAVPFLTERMTIISLATDGVDGVTPQPVAGAMADGKVADHCVVRGINYHDYLYANNSFHCLRELGCLLYTGPTGTNVGDIVMILVQ